MIPLANRTRRITRAACALALIAALAPLPALAQGSEPAGYRDTVDEAVREFGAHHYEEARSLFLQAHELYPNARTLRGLGLTQFELRNYGASIESLQAALASQEKPLTEELRADTERMLARAEKLVARVQVDAKPAASRVRLDGAEILTPSDAVLLIPVGEHTLELDAPGYATQTRRLSVQGGEQQTLTVVFTRTQSTELAEAHEARAWYKNPWLWGGVGVVLAGAAAGTGVALAGGSRRADPYGGSSSIVLRGE